MFLYWRIIITLIIYIGYGLYSHDTNLILYNKEQCLLHIMLDIFIGISQVQRCIRALYQTMILISHNNDPSEEKLKVLSVKALGNIPLFSDVRPLLSV